MNTEFRKSKEQHLFQKSPKDQGPPAKMAPTYPSPGLQHTMNKVTKNKHSHIKVKPSDWPPAQAIEPSADGSDFACYLFSTIPILLVFVLVLILKYKYLNNTQRRRNFLEDPDSGLELETFRNGGKMFDALDEMEAGEVELEGLLESDDGEDTSEAPF